MEEQNLLTRKQSIVAENKQNCLTTDVIAHSAVKKKRKLWIDCPKFRPSITESEWSGCCWHVSIISLGLEVEIVDMQTLFSREV